MYSAIKDQLQHELDEIRSAGLFKTERHIDSPQANHIKAGQIGESSADVLNFCANNYLGLADHPDIIAAAKAAMDERGFGMASVRFICGTQDLHLALEERVSEFLGTEDTILFSSCFDANGGVFEIALRRRRTPIISDALNHASIIDGIRLCKAQRFRYANRDMADLEAKLIEAATQENPARRKIIVTDGVFSMDGFLAPLEAICDLAEKYDALVMVDDSHAVGLHGRHRRAAPRSTPASRTAWTSTPARSARPSAAPPAATSPAAAKIVAMLRQKARPYLFSNSLAPAIVAATLKALDLVENSGELRSKLFANAALFRSRMTEEGFDLLPGEHADRPGDVRRRRHGRQGGRRRCCTDGVFVTAFSYPVVPQGRGPDPRPALRRAQRRRRRGLRAGLRAQPRRRRRLSGASAAEKNRGCGATNGAATASVCKDGPMSANYDVVIVGGGIAGLSLASALAGKCSVALVEAEQTLAYHTSARSARQLIPSYGPPAVQELTLRTLELIAAQDADRPEPVLSPRSFMLIGDDASRPGAGQRPHAADLPRRGDGTLPGPGPGFLHRRRPGHRLLRLQRAPCCSRTTAGGPKPAAWTSSPAPRVHSAQRLGSGWELGAGQEGFQAAVVVNAAGAWADELAVLSGVEKVQLQPYRRTAAIVDVEHPLPESCPMVAAADDSLLLPARRRTGPHLAVGTRTERPRGRAAAPGRHRSADRPAQHPHHARHPRRPHRLDGAADGSGRRCPGGGVRRRGPRILLARRPGRLRLPDVLRHRRAGRGPHPRRPGRRRVPGGQGPASRTAEALAATRWSIRR